MIVAFLACSTNRNEGGFLYSDSAGLFSCFEDGAAKLLAIMPKLHASVRVNACTSALILIIVASLSKSTDTLIIVKNRLSVLT